MVPLTISFVVSLLATWAIVKSTTHHGSLSADRDFNSPQKFHANAVPRIGGVGIFLALVAAILTCSFGIVEESRLMWWLLVCSLPTFFSGLAEDLTKRVSPMNRLVFTAVSAALGTLLLDSVIRRTGVPGLDTLTAFTPFAVALTVLMVTGVANAVNIIDGFNGLASMCVMMMLGALAYVAFQVSDMMVFTSSIILMGAIFGFFVWNFPAGLIFLGDGGAYLLGFVFAELGVLLIARNDSVSPLFPVLLCWYPIVETLFSIYRKKFLRGVSPGIPDGLHLHMLVYKRLMRWTLGKTARQKTIRNSMTSPYLWLICLLSVLPAALLWNNTAWLAIFGGIFVASYVFLYWSIVRFRVPKWFVVRRPRVNDSADEGRA